MNKIECLRRVVANFGSGQLTPGPLTGETFGSFGLARATMAPNLTLVGLKPAGFLALQSLAGIYLKDSPRYARGTGYALLLDYLFRLLLDWYFEWDGSRISNADLVRLDADVADWFDANASDHNLYVACLITTEPGPSFSVGPIRFVHLNEFVENHRGELESVALEPWINQTRSGHAGWLAEVDVTDSHKARAWERGELAVDLALCGIQLVIPENQAAHIARLYGRTLAPQRIKLSNGQNGFYWDMSNIALGLSMYPSVLQGHLSAGAAVLTSVGNRIDHFLSVGGALPNLNQAWADAAYWFHEGFAEPLDTIAVPKLETAIEVLLRAESAGGAECRLIKAIQAIYGLRSNQQISPHDVKTVAQFAGLFVTQRSRILHGTWSTLATTFGPSKDQLVSLVTELLVNYSVQLDAYVEAGQAADDIETFLNWIEARQAPPGSETMREPPAL